jgi:16S rRNA pseudouridine516 synthase
MRLDKFLSDMNICSRREAPKFLASGRVSVNGMQVKQPAAKINPDEDRISLGGEPIIYKKFEYIMLNKPVGVLSARSDGKGRTVLDLLPERYAKAGFFPFGRLDKDTVGLLIISNDGESCHRLLSPKKHVEKVYSFVIEGDLPDGAEAEFAKGFVVDEEFTALPAKLELDETRKSGKITITEGKFHQIKRMFAKFGCKVVYLKRESFGFVTLDPLLCEGEWRELTQDEIYRLI